MEIVGLHERDVLAEQVAHRAMLEPAPAPAPFAARRDQLIARQGLQDVQPTRSFARGRQRRSPKIVQSQLIPRNHSQPAGAPLTRATQPHRARSDRNHVAIERRRDTILGKQRDLPGLCAFVENLDRAAPRRFLAVVDLPRDRASAVGPRARQQPAGFRQPTRPDVPCRPCGESRGAKTSRRLPPQPPPRKGLGRHYGRFREFIPANTTARSRPRPQKSRPVGEVGVGSLSALRRGRRRPGAQGRP